MASQKFVPFQAPVQITRSQESSPTFNIADLQSNTKDEHFKGHAVRLLRYYELGCSKTFFYGFYTVLINYLL